MNSPRLLKYPNNFLTCRKLSRRCRNRARQAAANQAGLAAMLSGGHVLIEDTPGMGKTSLARALGHHLQLDWKRLQCTNDTTPSDIVGVNIFDPARGDFTFRQGPVFTPLLLADELNRAPSKSQSALLEAMAEGQVTIDGVGYDLPDPFIVIATQNPTEQIGVSPLPESQLDRFAVSFSLGLPRQMPRRIFCAMRGRLDMFAFEAPVLAADGFKALRAACPDVTFSDPMIAYLQELAGQLPRRPACIVGAGADTDQRSGASPCDD